jgi:hypothetical protein
MQSTDPLAQLHDIVLPQAVSWWPLAWGWWVLLVLILGISASIIFFWRRNIKHERYRKAALAELDKNFQDYQLEADVARYLQDLSVLLRRTAISAQPRSFPVDIKGNAWLLWLEAQCPEVKTEFSTGIGQILLTGPYQAKPQIDAQALQQLTRLWLQKHRNQWQKSTASKKVKEHKLEVSKHA